MNKGSGTETPSRNCKSHFENFTLNSLITLLDLTTKKNSKIERKQHIAVYTDRQETIKKKYELSTYSRLDFDSKKMHQSTRGW